MQERRRTLLVDRKTQLKYVGMVLGTVLFVNVLIGACIYFSIWSSLNTEYSKIAVAQKIKLAERIRSYRDVRTGQDTVASFDRSVDREAELLSDHLLMQLKDSFGAAQTKLIPILILLLLVIIFEGITISNRISGPIYHMERSLLRLADGDLSGRTHFRRKDEFHSLTEKYNRVVDEWNRHILSLRSQIGKISERADALKSSAGRYNPEGAAQVSGDAEQILRRVRECNTVLQRFTLADSGSTKDL